MAMVSRNFDSPGGNNWVDNVLARMSAMKRSYHSISVPPADARITSRSFFWSTSSVDMVVTLFRCGYTVNFLFLEDMLQRSVT